MATNLEARRQAIAAALRAVMAEPLPPASAPLHNATLAEPVTAPAPVPAPAAERSLTVVQLPVAEVESPVAATDAVDREHPPALREALAAGIDWDEVDDLTPLDPAEGFDDVDGLDDDWEAPSVPPLETAGSMSRAASVALFGHA